ncbi:hypothetical protein QLX08_009347 [Tetragonisca angustula]|uniref:Reverse transcriptase n=1 Tax=Tetragonisca angustula TaxID=166442 RepID=A0AAW0ZGR6_9HYME
MTLAGLTPYDLVANADRETYQHVREARSRGLEVPKLVIKQLRSQALVRANEIRKTEAEASNVASKQGVREILILWDTWKEKGVSSLTYRTTQVLSGHGGFGEYLHRTGAESHPGCHECGVPLDNAVHIVEECPAADPRSHHQSVNRE